MRALATTFNLRRWIRDCRQRAELISSLVESDRSFSLKYIHLDILLSIHREMRIMATYTHTHETNEHDDGNREKCCAATVEKFAMAMNGFQSLDYISRAEIAYLTPYSMPFLSPSTI